MPKKSAVASPKTAKLFMHGRSQAVKLPRDFRFKGDTVSIRRSGQSVILEPIITPKFATTAEWFAELDRLAKLADEPFMAGGREQPMMPPDRKIFD